MLLSVATIAATSFLLPAAAYTHHFVLYGVRVLQGFAEVGLAWGVVGVDV